MPQFDGGLILGCILGHDQTGHGQPIEGLLPDLFAAAGGTQLFEDFDGFRMVAIATGIETLLKRLEIGLEANGVPDIIKEGR